VWIQSLRWWKLLTVHRGPFRFRSNKSLNPTAAALRFFVPFMAHRRPPRVSGFVRRRCCLATIRCPYCHEYIDSAAYPAHEAEHLKPRLDGQQSEYATLPPEEREEGSLTGVPKVYRHRKCGVTTGMPEEIIRSYLKNPYMYMADATFCC